MATRMLSVRPQHARFGWYAYVPLRDSVGLGVDLLAGHPGMVSIGSGPDETEKAFGRSIRDALQGLQRTEPAAVDEDPSPSDAPFDIHPQRNVLRPLVMYAAADDRFRRSRMRTWSVDAVIGGAELLRAVPELEQATDLMAALDAHASRAVDVIASVPDQVFAEGQEDLRWLFDSSSERPLLTVIGERIGPEEQQRLEAARRRLDREMELTEMVDWQAPAQPVGVPATLASSEALQQSPAGWESALQLLTDVHANVQVRIPEGRDYLLEATIPLRPELQVCLTELGDDAIADAEAVDDEGGNYWRAVLGVEVVQEEASSGGTASTVHEAIQQARLPLPWVSWVAADGSVLAVARARLAVRDQRPTLIATTPRTPALRDHSWRVVVSLNESRALTDGADVARTMIGAPLASSAASRSLLDLRESLDEPLRGLVLAVVDALAMAGAETSNEWPLRGGRPHETQLAHTTAASGEGEILQYLVTTPASVLAAIAQEARARHAQVVMNELGGPTRYEGMSVAEREQTLRRLRESFFALQSIDGFMLG